MSIEKGQVINVLIVGIGGQGIMTAAEILAGAALTEGYDVRKTEVAGMAQRGGMVSSHVRFGEKVLSPSIEPGCADMLLGFEAAEAMRWIHYLRPDGVAMVNTLRLSPPVVSTGLYDYPEDPVASMRATGMRVHPIDAGELARGLGEMRLVNTVMLGALADHLPFPAEVLKQQVLSRFAARKPALVPINEQAFEAGRSAA